MNIQNKIDTILQKYRFWRAKRNLLKKYLYMLEVERMMEEWITKRIVEGQSGRREELKQKRAQIRETKEFINYLKKI